MPKKTKNPFDVVVIKEQRKKKKNKKKPAKKKDSAGLNTPQFSAPVPKNGNPAKTASAVARICSITDPFCYEAKGAKWTDGMGEATMPGQCRGHAFMAAVGATGSNIWAISPALNYTYLGGNSITAGVWTFNGNYSATPGAAAITTYAYQLRIVTAGIIIRNVLPALTSQGFLIINRISQAPATGSTINSGSVYGVQTACHALVTGLEIPVLFRPLGSASRAFAFPNTLSTTQPNFGFDVITVEVIGGPVTSGINMLDIEFVYNVEFTLTPANEGLQQFVPVAAPSNPVMVNVANKASEALGDLTYSGVQAFGNAAARIVKEKLMSVSGARSRDMMIDDIVTSM